MIEKVITPVKYHSTITGFNYDTEKEARDAERICHDTDFDILKSKGKENVFLSAYITPMTLERYTDIISPILCSSSGKKHFLFAGHWSRFVSSVGCGHNIEGIGFDLIWKMSNCDDELWTNFQTFISLYYDSYKNVNSWSLVSCCNTPNTVYGLMHDSENHLMVICGIENIIIDQCVTLDAMKKYLNI